jgi:hypothetical protein
VADLTMFLTWTEVPNLVLCRIDDRYGVGVVGNDGSSVATVTRRLGEPGWVEIRGEGDAQGLLTPHIERWEQLGCPTMADLRITVGYDDRPDPVPGASSEVAATVGRGITLEWETPRRAPHGWS